jgi:hypothetical protein
MESGERSELMEDLIRLTKIRGFSKVSLGSVRRMVNKGTQHKRIQ